MEIKTIMRCGDPPGFDHDVNAYLAERWELVEYGPRQVGPGQWAMYASLVKHDVKRAAVEEIDPLDLPRRMKEICKHRGGGRCGWAHAVDSSEHVCPLWGWCQNTPLNDRAPSEWRIPEEGEQ